MDGQEAAAVVVGMEQRQLLAAMHSVLGVVVDVQQDAARHLGEAVLDPLGIARIFDEGGQARRNPQPRPISASSKTPASEVN